MLMSALTAFLTSPAGDPEETTVTTPRRIPAVPGASGVPYWRAVPGLDPECPCADWRFAARFVAMRLAVLVFGPEAGRRKVFSKPQATPAGKFLAWLMTSPGEAEARVMFLALRLAAEQALTWQEVRADDVTDLAGDLCAGAGVIFP